MRFSTVPRVLAACLATSALASCGSSPTVVVSTEPSPSSQPGPDQNQEPGLVNEGSGREYSIEVKAGVPGPQASTVRAFIRFATAPTTASLGRVPFDRTGVTITLGGTEKHLTVAEIADAEAWSLSDNGGATSALVAISSSVKRAEGADTPRFEVSPRRLPICAADDLDDPQNASKAAQVFITLFEPDTPVTCAAGFRIGLEVDAFDTIHAVRLAVRAP